ncbi:Leucine-rich_repeat domain superfamily [Hexamita inflata]|uniref:Leucine-rich repeat domain superfamily n=1 Tax=Hexamita inflata TaxID=28002 RepID=A0AA86UUQ6_9EUKA|nr:Leucine-rich repeat domain superfamily [Hexamita inflata]
MLNLCNQNESSIKQITYEQAKTVQHLLIKSCNLQKLHLTLFVKLHILDISQNSSLIDYSALQYVKELQQLYINFCNLDSLDRLPPIESLTLLSCCNNNISTLKYISKFPSLHTLNITNNKIDNLVQTPQQVTLQMLNIGNNPITQISFFEQKIRSIFIKLKILNNRQLQSISFSHSLALQLYFNTRESGQQICLNQYQIKFDQVPVENQQISLFLPDGKHDINVQFYTIGQQHMFNKIGHLNHKLKVPDLQNQIIVALLEQKGSYYLVESQLIQKQTKIRQLKLGSQFMVGEVIKPEIYAECSIIWLLDNETIHKGDTFTATKPGKYYCQANIIEMGKIVQVQEAQFEVFERILKDVQIHLKCTSGPNQSQYYLLAVLAVFTLIDTKKLRAFKFSGNTDLINNIALLIVNKHSILFKYLNNTQINSFMLIQFQTQLQEHQLLQLLSNEKQVNQRHLKMKLFHKNNQKYNNFVDSHKIQEQANISHS